MKSTPAITSFLSLAALLGVVFLLSFHEIWDRDIFFHLAHGRALLEHGVPLRENLFVWAASELPFYQNPAWLFGVLMALLHDALGMTGVVLLKCLLLLLLYLMLYRFLREHEVAPAVATGFLFLAAMGSSLRMNERPEIFTFLFFGLLVWRIGRYRATGEERLWWLPPLFVLWANLHSGFIFGLLLLLLELGGELLSVLAGGRWPSLIGSATDRRRLGRFAAVLALSGAATFLAPQPLGNYRFLLQHLHVTSVVPVAEYGFPTLALVPWFWVLLGAVLLLLCCRPRRLPPADLLPAGFFLALAFSGVRFIPLFAMAILPLLAPRLAALSVSLPLCQDGFLQRRSPLLSALGLALPLLLVLVPLIFPPVPGRHVIAVNRTQTPLDAFRFLRDNPVAGHLFNSMSFGAAAMFYLYPQYRLYQSSYIQVEEDRQAEAWRASKEPQSWRVFLDRHRIDVALVDIKYEEPSPRYFPPDDWAMVFFDDIAAVYVRRTPHNGELIEANEYRVIHPAAILGDGRATAIDMNNYREGLMELQRALRASPDSFLVHLLLGYYYNAAQGEQDTALQHFSRAAALNTEAVAARFHQGRLLYESGHYADAAGVLRHYVKQVPEDPLGYLYLARSCREAGDVATAVNILRRGIERNPSEVALHHLLGALLRDSGDLSAALEQLRSAVQMAPNHPEVLKDLALALDRAGDYQAALGVYDKALSLAPDSASIRARREETLRHMNQQRP